MLMTTLVVAVIIVRKEMIEALMVVDLFTSSKPLSAYLTNAFNILLVLWFSFKWIGMHKNS